MLWREKYKIWELDGKAKNIASLILDQPGIYAKA